MDRYGPQALDEVPELAGGLESAGVTPVSDHLFRPDREGGYPAGRRAESLDEIGRITKLTAKNVEAGSPASTF